VPSRDRIAPENRLLVDRLVPQPSFAARRTTMLIFNRYVGSAGGSRSAIVGSIKTRVAGWDDQLVNIKTEQSAVFDGERVIYLGGRQTEWHVIQ
jgi:hypothetical protein